MAHQYCIKTDLKKETNLSFNKINIGLLSSFFTAVNINLSTLSEDGLCQKFH